MRLKSKNDKLKDKDLQELARLCGSSLLYLPPEYATGSLAVPTCFRATAQYLVQHGNISLLLCMNEANIVQPLLLEGSSVCLGLTARLGYCTIISVP